VDLPKVKLNTCKQTFFQVCKLQQLHHQAK